MKIDNWKLLQRHPLSAEYKDIEGEAWDRFLVKLNKYGIMNDRKIVLYLGKVLDGWQLHRGCIELNITPEYEELPEECQDQREYVEMMNDERRHETPSEIAVRIAKRKLNVINARRKGESIRTIAEQEGVSPTTIQRDLESATVPGGGTVEPLGGKVVGQDNKIRDAKKPILCNFCQHRKDVGRPLIEKCEACAAAKKAAKSPQNAGETEETAAPKKQRCIRCANFFPDSDTSMPACMECARLTAAGIPAVDAHCTICQQSIRRKQQPEKDCKACAEVQRRCLMCDRCIKMGQSDMGCEECGRYLSGEKEPRPYREATFDDDNEIVPASVESYFQAVPLYDLAMKQLNAVAKTLREIEQCPTRDLKPLDPSMPFTKFSPTFRNARARVLAMRPALVCKTCKGEGCDKCDRGVLTTERVEVPQ